MGLEYSKESNMEGGSWPLPKVSRTTQLPYGPLIADFSDVVVSRLFS
jgi:hypothetical protein